MQASRKFLMFTLTLNFCLFCYGQGSGESPSSVPNANLRNPFSPLNGNWHLTGVYSSVMTRRRLPFLSLAIETDGNVIHGRGNVFVGCQDSWWGRGGGVSFTGKIASDGSFEVSDDQHLDDSQLSIHGTAPVPGAAAWQGGYNIKILSQLPNCTVNQSGTFTATKYPPFTGTYTGAVTEIGFSTGVTVTVQVTQGEPGHYSPAGFVIPLGGQITVSGSSCFSSGTATNRRSNDIQGDAFLLSFSMNDGSLLQLFGNRFWEESDESTIRIRMSVEGGHCNAHGTGTLTLLKSNHQSMDNE